MSAVPTSDRYPVRVMVTPVWDHVPVAVDRNTTILQLKRDALSTALKRPDIQEADYVVKFRGALVDESATMGSLRAGPNAPFIVLPARRQPVR